MGKVNFTTERVSGFECPPSKKQCLHWDAKTPGLGVRVTAGAKSYIFETRLYGKTIRLTIGDVRTWTVGKAQEKATLYKTLTDQGIDPRQQMADQRIKHEAAAAESVRQGLTLAEVWVIYAEARKPKWTKKTYDDHLKYAQPGGLDKKVGKGLTVAMPLAPLMPLQLSELTPERVTEWLKTESAVRATSTALCFRMLRAFINWTADKAAYKGIIPANACSASTVKDVIPTSKSKEGDCLQREQLPAWFNEVQKRSPVISAYLQALLLTGARREELGGLRWEDVDFQWKSLTIRDKIEGSRIIPLTPYVASLLLSLKRINDAPPNVRQLRRLDLELTEWAPSPWVFFSQRGETGRLISPTKAHSEAVAAAGLPHLTLHGLRRSFGTLSEWVEVPAGVVAQIQGHKPSAIAEKHYRRRPIDLLRKWHDQIEAWILEQAGVSQDPPKKEH